MPKGSKRPRLSKEDRDHKAECDLKEIKRLIPLLQALIDKHKPQLSKLDKNFDSRPVILEFQALCTRKCGHADDWLTRPRSANMLHWEDFQQQAAIQWNERLLKKFKTNGALMRKLNAGKGNATHHYEAFMDSMWRNSQWFCDEAYRPEGVPRPPLMGCKVTYGNDEQGRMVLGATEPYEVGTPCPDPDAGSYESLVRASRIAAAAGVGWAPRE